jgi:hypothetical protein
MKTLDEKQRATLLDRLFRRIGKLDDESLIRLETMTRPAETGGAIAAPAKAQGDQDQLSRRYFITALLAGGILAASAGGAGALALNDDKVRQWLADQGWIATTPPTAAPSTAMPGPSLTPTLPAEARTQIATLQNQLASVIQQRDAFQQQVTQVSGQLASLQSNHDLLKGLLDLYQQLDNTNLDQIVIDALGALGMPVVAIETLRVAVSNGVTLTVKVLQAIEDQMPLIAAGLDWLEQQIATLELAIRSLRTALDVANVGDFTKSVGDFVSQVLGMLPFGAGDNIKNSLMAMGNVINQLPTLLDNVNTRLLQPARTWIVSDQQSGLYASLLRPVREQMLMPSQQMVANAQNLNSVYNTQLAQPAQTALDQRAKIRAEITKKAGALQG